MGKKHTENNRYREEELQENPNLEDDEPLHIDEEMSEVEKLKKDLEEAQNNYLRVLADLQNFKKHTNEERINERKYHLQSILEELVDIIDLFDCVVNVNTDDEKVKSFLIGFQMLNQKFKDILANNDVKKIDALNQPFDERYHEATSLEYVEGVEPGICVKVTTNGYMYKDRVLKPSKVIVSKEKEN